MTASSPCCQLSHKHFSSKKTYDFVFYKAHGYTHIDLID